MVVITTLKINPTNILRLSHKALVWIKGTVKTLPFYFMISIRSILFSNERGCLWRTLFKLHLCFSNTASLLLNSLCSYFRPAKSHCCNCRLKKKSAFFVPVTSAGKGYGETTRHRPTTWKGRGASSRYKEQWRGREPERGRWAACPSALAGCTWGWVSSPGGWFLSCFWTPHWFPALFWRKWL